MTAGILSAVDPMTVLWSALVLLALAVVFGVLLAVLGKKFAVKKDAREEEIRKHLPGANCGGCGYAGCDALAAAMAEGKAGANACPVMKPDARKAVAELLGEEADGVPTVLVVACSGGNAAADKYDYMGYGDCRSMELLGGGRKACPWGCLGMGSCADACPVHAAGVGDEGHAAIDREKCIGCGKCAAACPKKLIVRIPADAAVYVACSNRLRGAKQVHERCARGRIGCGLCARNCPSGAIEMKDNLPVIDYAKCTRCGICADKCPAKCIKRLQPAAPQGDAAAQ